MKWQNEPTSWTHEKSCLSVTSEAKTDFWRLTHDGGIRHSGHFFFQTVSGDFRLTARFFGAYQDQYDQSGLMIALDEAHWIKCGIEFVDRCRRPSVVVTREQSDWAISPETAPSEVIFQLVRTKDLVEISFGATTSDLCLFRQLTFPSKAPLQAGLMTASPTGKGFQTQFRKWTID